MINKQRLEKILEILQKKYSKIEKLGVGKRSVTYLLDNSFVAKIERDDIKTSSVARNEFEMLTLLKNYPYFPKPVSYDAGLRFLVMSAAKGMIIRKILDKNIFLECLSMARCLDKAGVEQTELTNPFKHIFADSGKIMMIDFERARRTSSPRNVSQFVQYIMDRRGKKDEEIIRLTREYKKGYSDKSFNDLFYYITSYF